MNFKFWNSENDMSKNSPSIFLNWSLNNKVVEFVRKKDRIIVLKLVLGEKTLNIYSVYIPYIDLDKCTKVKFWEYLYKTMQRIS